MPKNQIKRKSRSLAQRVCHIEKLIDYLGDCCTDERCRLLEYGHTSNCLASVLARFKRDHSPSPGYEEEEE